MSNVYLQKHQYVLVNEVHTLTVSSLKKLSEKNELDFDLDI